MRTSMTYSAVKLWIFIFLLSVVVGDQIGLPGDTGGRVSLDAGSGKVVITEKTPGLKQPGALVKDVWITVSFPSNMHARQMAVIVAKDGKSAEITLEPQLNYARGYTRKFMGTPVVGEWKVSIKGERPPAIGVFMTIDCESAQAPAPSAGGSQPVSPITASKTGIVITPEIQFQALTRILIRKGVITAPELAEEIQKVAAERR